MNINIEKVGYFYKKYENIIHTVLVLIIFFCLTIFNPDMQNFNKDEIHAWNIAANLNFIEIIKLMRVEGHTFVWYMLLKPFTYKPDLFFPWIIKYLNWIFIFLSLILIWMKSPQNNFFKVLITFSLPFTYLAILGRCYGIGIFLLCCIATLYNNKLRHPVIFALLLFFCANTSLVATFGIWGIALCFLYDLCKTNFKKNIIPIIIILLTPVTLYIQWHNHIIPNYVDTTYLLKDAMIYHLFDEYRHIAVPAMPAIIILSGLFICFAYFKENKRILFYVTSNYLLFFLLSVYFYTPFNYHYLFMFILLWIYDWLFINTGTKNNIKNENIIMSYNIWFIMICILFSPLIREDGKWFTPKKEYKARINCIQSYVSEGSTIYSSMNSLGHDIPYLKDKYILKTYSGEDLLSFKSFFYTYNKKYINDYHEKYLKSLPDDGTKRYLFADVNHTFDKMPSKKVFGKYKNCKDMYIYTLKK